MFERMRIVTLLMMVLVIFVLLQLISISLFFSSLNGNQQRFNVYNLLNMKKNKLGQVWDIML